MESSDDYYAILGVERTAGRDEIRAAYHAKLAALDGNGLSETERIAAMKPLADALAVLGHRRKRAVYDECGRVDEEVYAGASMDAERTKRLSFGGVWSFRTLLVGVVSSVTVSLLLVSQIENPGKSLADAFPDTIRLAQSAGAGMLFVCSFLTCFITWGVVLSLVMAGLLSLLQLLKKTQSSVELYQVEIGYYLLLFVLVAPAHRFFITFFFNCAVWRVPLSDYYSLGLFALANTAWWIACIWGFESVVWHRNPRVPYKNFLNFFTFTFLAVGIPITNSVYAGPYMADYALVNLLLGGAVVNLTVLTVGLLFYGLRYYLRYFDII